jgi:hypothetical protein
VRQQAAAPNKEMFVDKIFLISANRDRNQVS